MVIYLLLIMRGLSMKPIFKTTALAAFVGDDEALFRVGIGADGVQDTAAVRRAVAGIDVDVEGAETVGAVVAGRIAERRHLTSAIFADKAAVVFCKAFDFHKAQFFPPFTASQ